MALRWTLRPHDAQLVESIERQNNISPILAQILALRGISRTDQVASFLDLKMTGLRDPSELPGITEATELIYSAIAENKKIAVYGDYDCDGMTATAILVRCLTLLGANVSYFVPHRVTDGYGLNNDALKKLHDDGIELIVTVDCGIASVAEVAFAKQLGLQIVITDHHHHGATLPDADAVVHPALPGREYPFPGLCGAAVAFKLAWSLCQCHHGSPKLPENLRNFLFGAISLAAIGTVADVVPLLDENRILVHHGLNCIKQFANPGLRHLIRVAKCAEKPRIDAEDVAFMIGPRLNAVGRLSQARLGVELLITDSEERGEKLADYIENLNQDRKTLDRRILLAANKLIQQDHDPKNDPAIVLAHEDWHLGVIGIVAGRIAEKHNRPTVLISTDPLGNRPGVGSCRSACGIDLYEALSACREKLIGFGGHSAAAGLQVKPDQIDDFREEFFEQVILQSSEGDQVADLEIDAEVFIGHLNLATMQELEKLAPFGDQNPRPVFCATEVRLLQPAQPMGAEGRHMSLQLGQHDAKIRAVAFGKGEWVEELADTESTWDFAFRPVVNEFRGYRSVELHLIDFRPSKRSSEVSSGT